VKIAAAAVPLTTPGLWLTAAERGVLLAGLAVALGGLAGRGLSRQYKGERGGPLPGPWALRGALLGLAASAALALTAVAGPVLAARLAVPAPAGLPDGGTATIAGVEAALFALAAILLRVRRPGCAAVLLCGVVLAEAIRSHPEGVIPVAGALVTCCHLLPAVLWAGMLLYALRAGLAWRDNPAAAQGIIGLYATAAAWLFTLVVISGVVSALVLVPLGALLHTTYGLFLIAKAVLVCGAAGLALAGRRWLRGRPAAGAGPSVVTRLEVAALAAVLILAGVLTVLTPPVRAGAAPAGAGRSVTARQPAGAITLVKLPEGRGAPCAGARGRRSVTRGQADEDAMRSRRFASACGQPPRRVGQPAVPRWTVPTGTGSRG
jgi:copper transport protein